MNPTGSALQQATQQFQQLQGNQQPSGQPQVAQGAAQNPLEQSFMQFLQQQHGQMGENSPLKFLPWFSQAQQPPQGQPVSPTQQGIQQVAQTAFQPPTQSQGANPPIGSGGAHRIQYDQQQGNSGGDQSNLFPSGFR